jgi:hypothetical protein
MAFNRIEQVKNKILEEIKIFAKKRLMAEYGYCRIAEGDDMAIINSGKGSENLIIKFEDKKD